MPPIEKDSQFEDMDETDKSLIPIYEWGNRLTAQAKKFESSLENSRIRFIKATKTFERDINLAELIRDGGFIDDIEIQRDKRNRRIFLVNDKRYKLPMNFEDEIILEETLGNMADKLFLKANIEFERERRIFKRAKERYKTNIIQLFPDCNDFSEAMNRLGIAKMFSDTSDNESKSIVPYRNTLQMQEPPTAIGRYIKKLNINLDNFYEVYSNYLIGMSGMIPVELVNILFIGIHKELKAEFDIKIQKGEISPLYKLKYQIRTDVHPEDLEEF